MTTLYSIACERFNRKSKTWEPTIEYLHAEDAGHARSQFCLANPNRKLCKIVAIGPVIGYNVNDDKGESLSVD